VALALAHWGTLERSQPLGSRTAGAGASVDHLVGTHQVLLRSGSLLDRPA